MWDHIVNNLTGASTGMAMNFGKRVGLEYAQWCAAEKRNLSKYRKRRPAETDEYEEVLKSESIEGAELTLIANGDAYFAELIIEYDAVRSRTKELATAYDDLLNALVAPLHFQYDLTTHSETKGKGVNVGGGNVGASAIRVTTMFL